MMICDNMNDKSKQIMTSSNIKTLLFASLIAAMILPFSGMNYAVAEELDKEKVEKIAKKAQKLMEKIETEDNPKKIQKIQKQLNKLLAKLNSVGLYTEKQFEVIKEERLDDYLEEEILSRTSRAYCSSCNDPAVKIKVGFDYRLWGFYGTANGNWDTITNVDKNGFSTSKTGSWGG